MTPTNLTARIEAMINESTDAHENGDNTVSALSVALLLLDVQARLAQVPTFAPQSNVGTPPGEISDGYHTFNELYEHRHALFAVACHFLKGWKSKEHDDGTMFPGWFIAGLTTPQGPATYHLPIRLWDRFPGQILDRAPAWDGHTSQDVIDRLWSAFAPQPEAAPASRFLSGDSHGRALSHDEGGYTYTRGGKLLFQASHGSRAIDLWPDATTEDMQALIFALASRLLIDHTPPPADSGKDAAK